MSGSTENKVMSVLEDRNIHITAEEIAKELNMSRSRISSILKSLYNRDILIAKKKGTKVYYKLNEEAYRDLKYSGKTSTEYDFQRDAHHEKNRNLMKLFFSLKNDVISIYRKETHIHSIESLRYRPSKKAVQSYIESFTYPTNIDLWELSPGHHTNYDIDILSMRCNPVFVTAVTAAFLKDNRNIMDRYDGIICIRKKEENISTPISIIYTKNSIPYGISLTLKTDKPVIITDGKNIEDIIEKHSHYLLIDDYSVPGDSTKDIVDKIRQKAIVDMLVIFEREGSALENLRKSKIKVFSMFHLSDTMKNIHTKINVLSNPQYR